MGREARVQGLVGKEAGGRVSGEGGRQKGKWGGRRVAG